MIFRAKLEENYVKSLKAWHRKWTEHLRNDSSEYETSKDAWQAFLNLGSQTADVHSDLNRGLIKPINKIKNWLKSKYEKKYFNFKATNDFEVSLFKLNIK